MKKLNELYPGVGVETLIKSKGVKDIVVYLRIQEVM